MAGGVTLQVRQVASYPLVGSAGAGDLLLMQPGGLGNPYASVDARNFAATALNAYTGLALGVGYVPPPTADPAQIFVGNHVLPTDGGLAYNCYWTGSNLAAWMGGASGVMDFDPSGAFQWLGGSAPPQQPLPTSLLMRLSIAGALSLPNGTLTVARDPGAAMEVATMGWVGANTVASFNGRRGVVQLTSADIYGALCLDSCIATENWVNGQIQRSIQLLLANHPFVFGWNGRTGAVYLTLADITCVFFQPGQQPVTQTPPLTSNDYSIPNTQWVVEYIANEFAGGGTTLATQAWVLANTVNSFNGRQGVVTLTSTDVFDVGAAPLNSPAFSGIPTAPTAAVGQATGQIATTAFVQQAITNNTAGVSTFNTRSGDVTLEAADVIGVGGLVNPSAGLTGNPTCPTQPPGTNLPVLANCEFVQAAIAAGTVTSFNTRTGAVTLTLADVTGVGGAPLVSPAFSSVPTAPTAAPGTNTVQLATTAFVQAAVTAAGGVSSFNSRTGAVTLAPNDISAAGGLVNPSVGLTGSPTATTATAGDNSTRIATTAFVQTALSSGAVSSFNSRTGAVTLQGADITAAGGALLASPAFTGAPTAPTAAAGTNNTQIATTAYVTAAILADTTGVTSFNMRTGAVTLITADITGAGGAPIASPSFTGVPLGPTATAGTSTTQLATTAFVQAAIASSGVSSFNSRTGAVTLIANDISAAGGALLAGPTFTGTPAAPTAALGTNTAQLATTAFVAAAITAQGGPFLPLAGGVLTGDLQSSARLSMSTATLPAAAIAGTAFVQSLTPVAGSIWFNAYANSGSTAAYLTANQAAVSSFVPATGVLNWQVFASGAANATLGATNAQMQLSTAGLLINAAAFGGYAILSPANSGTDYQVLNIVLTSSGGNQMVASSGGSTWTWPVNSSDRRLKTNITLCSFDALGALAKLPVYSLDLTSPIPGAVPQHWDCSVIADEVEPLFPAAFIAARPDGYQSINLQPLVCALIRAVQQLTARVAALEAPAMGSVA